MPEHAGRWKLAPAWTNAVAWRRAMTWDHRTNGDESRLCRGPGGIGAGELGCENLLFTFSSAGPSVPAGGAGAPSSGRRPAGAAATVARRAHPTLGPAPGTGLGASSVRFADDHDRPAFSAPRDASAGPASVQVVPRSRSRWDGATRKAMRSRGAPPGSPSARRGQNRQGQGGRKKAGQAIARSGAALVRSSQPLYAVRDRTGGSWASEERAIAAPS
jgi:hypothetical protein